MGQLTPNEQWLGILCGLMWLLALIDYICLVQDRKKRARRRDDEDYQ